MCASKQQTQKASSGYHRKIRILALFIKMLYLQVRAHVEKQIGLIAAGKAEKEAVVAHLLHQFAGKFAFFMQHINRMDQLFEASFSPLASSGKPQF